jgi:hypothetical protein
MLASDTPLPECFPGMLEDLAELRKAKSQIRPALFRPPGAIKVLDCRGDEIAVRCANGDVLYLRASFMVQQATSKVLEAAIRHKEPRVDRSENKKLDPTGCY